MVKIIGLTEEEIIERQRLSKLVAITQQVFPETRVRTLDNHYNYLSLNFPGDQGGEITVHLLTRNEIYVYNISHLNQAVKLAEAYERSGEQEFTVKKLYSE